MAATYSMICFNKLEFSDWVDLLAIIVNSILAVWIVRTIQNKLTNKRVLKDYFIEEIKAIRYAYKEHLDQLYSSKVFARELIPWFKMMNIRVDDTMDYINQKYKIDRQLLKPYQIELRALVTETEDFIEGYSSDGIISFSTKSKAMIIKFQQENNHLFNELIIRINDAV